MAVAMLVNDHPNRSAPAATLLVLVAVASTALAVRVYRSLFRARELVAS
jgi:hypothetical protein